MFHIRMWILGTEHNSLVGMSQDAQLNFLHLLVSGKVTTLQALKFCDGCLETITV